ncbi:MAG: O-acetylhomoserine aminocarboxypropyltransferase/cysteine synthase [Fibrobacter sp.]|nr:O-acetylhomoserine aminocarboxypropyltransferase/cysteine synthase [Fibrobacter sp.]
MSGFATRALHSPWKLQDPHGTLRPPLYDSVAFEFQTSRELELAFTGRKPAHTYSRITNPTVEVLEDRIRNLANASAVLAVSSGMAAISNTVQALAQSGSNIVTTRHLFSHSLSLFTQTLGRWGLETRFADMTSLESAESQIDNNTALVFLEIISNPQLEVAEIEKICALAAGKNVPVVLDGTLTTPYLFNSRLAGVAVEIISSTKHISGGATAVGGLIIDNGVFDWRKHAVLGNIAGKFGPGAFSVRLRKDVYRNNGACLSAHNAWLQILGLETLKLRIDKSCSNALQIAGYLKKHPKVLDVNYPGLPGSPWHEIAKKQFNNGFGGIVTFELSDKEQAYRFMDSLKIIRRATNLSDNKTLVIHPASTIFAEYSLEERKSMGIPEGLIRLSVGIEDVEDLVEDINQGLESL